MNEQEKTAAEEPAMPDYEGREKTEEIEHLPTEAIGSYARIEEVMTDEDGEEGSNPTAQS